MIVEITAESVGYQFVDFHPSDGPVWRDSNGQLMVLHPSFDAGRESMFNRLPEIFHKAWSEGGFVPMLAFKRGSRR